MVIQPDGKILVGGSALWRYNSNGTPDLTFGIDGKMASPFNDGSPFNCGAVTLQKDGKIVITGNSNYAIIARYNVEGSLDGTFGTNGETIIYYYNNPHVHGKSIAITNDGKIVASGYVEFIAKGYKNSEFAITRLNSDGSPDLTFGTGVDGDGLIFTGPNELSYGTSLLVQSDNKIILSGYSFDGADDDFTIVRYNTDGTLDNTFSGDGIEITRAGTSHNRIESLTLDDDRLYAVGFGQYPDNLGVVARYLLSSGGALPVSLTNFTATLKNTSVLLQWQTASEQDLSYFTIERSANSNSFSPITNVAAKGNASLKMDYSTYDQQPIKGINFYRLKIFDKDGKFTYSKIASVNVLGQFSLRIFPNPANNILLVQATGNNEKAVFQIEDVIGRRLKQIQVNLNGNTSLSIDINSLPGGMYNLVLYKSNKTEIQKFIKE